MIAKIVGLIGFIFFIFYTGMDYSLGWFEGVSLLVVAVISLCIWIAAALFKRKPTLLIRAVSIMVGAVYGVIWLVILIAGDQIHAWTSVVLPVGYGIIFSIVYDLTYYKSYRSSQKLSNFREET